MLKNISFLFLNFIFCFCFAQNSSLKQNTENAIRSGNYNEAISILEKNITEIKTDTAFSELFDDLGELYFLQNDWNKISELYTGHHFEKDEDTTLLTLAHFFHSAPKEKMELASAATLPFKPSVSGTPIVEVVINGKVHYFWLDTGAGMSVVTQSVAKEIKLKGKFTDAQATAATGNQINIGYGLIDSIRIGALKVFSHPCLVLSDKQLEFRFLGIRFLKVEGIIGWNLWQQLSVTINYPEKKLTVGPSLGTIKANPNLFWMNVPLVNCTDASGKPLLFTFDTGGDVSAVYAPYKQKEDTTHAIPKTRTIGSAGGTKKMRTLKFPDVTVTAGGTKLMMHGLLVNPSVEKGALAPDGVLGAATLRKYVMHFDLYSGIFELKLP